MGGFKTAQCIIRGPWGPVLKWLGHYRKVLFVVTVTSIQVAPYHVVKLFHERVFPFLAYFNNASRETFRLTNDQVASTLTKHVTNVRVGHLQGGSQNVQYFIDLFPTNTLCTGHTDNRYGNLICTNATVCQRNLLLGVTLQVAAFCYIIKCHTKARKA